MSLYIANQFTEEYKPDDAEQHLKIAKDLMEKAKSLGHPDADAQLSVMRLDEICLLYTSPSPRDRTRSRMPSSA